jgi:hypothetical protein
MQSDHVVIEVTCGMELPQVNPADHKSRQRIPWSRTKDGANPKFAACVKETADDIVAMPPDANIHTLFETMESTANEHMTYRGLRSARDARTEIQRLRGWAQVAIALFTESQKGPKGVAQVSHLCRRGGPVSPFLHWLPCVRDRTLPWSSVHDLLKSWASRMEQALR